MPDRPESESELERALRLAAKAKREAADIAADDEGASAAAESVEDEEAPAKEETSAGRGRPGAG